MNPGINQEYMGSIGFHLFVRCPLSVVRCLKSYQIDFLF
jgi:hypothetical protein